MRILIRIHFKNDRKNKSVVGSSITRQVDCNNFSIFKCMLTHACVKLRALS